MIEDIGTGDLTAELIPADQRGAARVIVRERAVICGAPWVDACFQSLDSATRITWHVREGHEAQANDVVFEAHGAARALLTAERTALNFLQTLSAAATVTRRFVNAIDGTNCKILDTRKTLPGLRTAQKYAARVGGATNHRLGLYDAVLIKENHIAAAGSLRAAVERAQFLHPQAKIQVEVENIEQLNESISTRVEFVLLDNFSLDNLRRAVAINRDAGRPLALEASGGVTLENVRRIADTGVDFISVGSLTKDVKAVDLSMRFEWA